MRQSTISRLRQSLPLGLWDHLQNITYLGHAPLPKHIQVFKQLKALRFLTWELLEEPFGLGFDETFDLPESIEKNKWSIELGFFLLSFTTSRFYFLNGKFFDEGVYEDLNLPFNFNLYLPIYARVYHPGTGRPGLIDVTIVVDLTVFAPISYIGELAYYRSDEELRYATGPGIEWTGKWCEVEYPDLEMEAVK